MKFTSRRAFAGAALLAVTVAGCGQAAAASRSQSTTTATTSKTPTTTMISSPAKTKATTTTATMPAASPGTAARVRFADHLLVDARALYANQVDGQHSLAVLHQLGSDPTLLRLLRSGNLASVRAYVARQYPRVWYHWHVSRMRIERGSQVITEMGVPFVLPAASMKLPTGDTLQISMQDEIGFVRLMHRRYPVQVVIHGSGGEVRASMHAAGVATLPMKGYVTLGGQRYVVRSFKEPAWNGEHVTIWILTLA